MVLLQIPLILAPATVTQINFRKRQRPAISYLNKDAVTELDLGERGPGRSINITS
jgi:hypothetical protein